MKRILIVDDIEENLYFLRTLLEGHGYKVDQAGNGREAITKAQEKVPDMIISDILMPVMDGYTLCREWKTDDRLKHIPFIFYTASYTDPRDEQLAIDMGADEFIVKPTEPDEFMSRVENILALDKEGKPDAAQEPKAGDESILKNYNEALIRKLEQKMIELEKLNRELEAKVASRTADLEMANKDLESFSFSISHDLKAPLRHISGFVDMLRRETGDTSNEKASHYMEVISESAKRMAQLIDDLLYFSRLWAVFLCQGRLLKWRNWPMRP